MRTRNIATTILVIVATASLTGCNYSSMLRGDLAQDLKSQYSSLLPGSPEQQLGKLGLRAVTEKAVVDSSEQETAQDIEKDVIEDAVEEETKQAAPHEHATEQTTPPNNDLPNTAKKLLQIKEKKDLWERLRAGFKLKIPDNAVMERHIGWLEKHPKYIKRLQDQAKPYIHFILTEAEKRNLPTELALLPAVESFYRPFAYSHGSAAGLWQFIPSTGRHFKLKQNWWYDGRRDVVASTHAAFDYLESLARRFDGNWELAMAAYNCGAGNVNKAIRKNRRKGKPTDFWSLDLPKETSSYVPKLLALSNAIKDPEKSGIELRPIPNQPYFASVDIGSQLDLAIASDMAGISTDGLYRLNPGLNRWATDPDGPHRLNLPVAMIEGFKQNLAQLDPSQRIHWKRHKISSGDTISTIAQKYGTTSALIRQTNELNKDSSIRAGKYLIIPTATKSLEHYGLSASKRKKQIQDRKRKGSKLIHVVEAGDNFWDLSREYKVNHRSLAKWNGMAPGDTLKLAQKLVVWVDDATFKKHSSAKIPPSMKVRPPNSRNSVYYRVREGDSLSTIAQRFKVKIADLKKWNKLSGKYLKPGQNLKLYVDVTAQSL